MKPVDVSVIGGGPAGSAAALHLARAGLRVRLYEKQTQAHHKVCGEFLSGEALTELRGLGVDVAALGALPLGEVGFAGARQHEPVRSALPFAAASLSRAVLDETLLQHVAAAGVELVRGRSLRLEELVDPCHGQLFVATGKHDPRDHARPSQHGDLLGFKMHFRTAQALDLRVDLLPFPRGYAGLQPVAPHTLNLCLLVDRDAYLQHGCFNTLLAELRTRSPYLDTLLLDSRPLWNKPLAVRPQPYGFVRTETERHWWLGDQAAVIPSFSGDGISIALYSGRCAAEALLAGHGARHYQSALAAKLQPQVQRAQRLAGLLVQPWFQPLAGHAVRVMPTMMQTIARQTRIDALDYAA